MSEVIVIGHRNPDTDSACSAWSYARLKNAIDPENRYLAAVCGPLGNQAKFVFSNAGLEPPTYVKDIKPRVVDVADADGLRLDSNDPLLMAFEDLDESTISVVPVFEGANKFAGIIGIHEMTSYFVENSLKARPAHTFRADNIQRVLPGRFIQRGQQEEFEAPFMIGAMNLEHFVRRLNELGSAKPIIVLGNRPELINHAISQQVPAIILTGLEKDEVPSVDFSAFSGLVFVSEYDTAETIRLLRLSVPVKQIMDAEPLCLAHDELFDNAKKTLVSSEYRGLPVLRDGSYVGSVTRSSFIEKPRRKMILMDHNELGQAIPGAEDAEICEILDHHRLGAEKTSKPIYLYSKPIGSTCSIVYIHYRMAGVTPDKSAAIVMLSGLLSDTMLLRSPTTTPEDRVYAGELAQLAGVDLQEYGSQLLSCTTCLKSTDPLQIVKADFKEYADGDLSVGVGQVEVSTLEDIDEAKARMLDALNTARKEHNLTWALLLVTDIIKEHSVLLCTTWAAGEKELAYKKLEDNLFDLPGVLSRKKQLLPEILRILDVLKKK
ncbi:putative manganese-dependent inorganic diphosphatase [Propionivibrio limicola]|uniref:putative manganese-dependent inorganic diphosphatase n=1 Tax=Propionivibrio limicola TaxID=167645 RepID=UPI001291D4B3|nr:putative manganese-dependent inorganic diphosphatase [Propionivibrio limicola]